MYLPVPTFKTIPNVIQGGRKIIVNNFVIRCKIRWRFSKCIHHHRAPGANKHSSLKSYFFKSRNLSFLKLSGATLISSVSKASRNQDREQVNHNTRPICTLMWISLANYRRCEIFSRGINLEEFARIITFVRENFLNNRWWRFYNQFVFNVIENVDVHVEEWFEITTLMIPWDFFCHFQLCRNVIIVVVGFLRNCYIIICSLVSRHNIDVYINWK